MCNFLELNQTNIFSVPVCLLFFIDNFVQYHLHPERRKPHNQHRTSRKINCWKNASKFQKRKLQRKISFEPSHEPLIIKTVTTEVNRVLQLKRISCLTWTLRFDAARCRKHSVPGMGIGEFAQLSPTYHR